MTQTVSNIAPLTNRLSNRVSEIIAGAKHFISANRLMAENALELRPYKNAGVAVNSVVNRIVAAHNKSIETMRSEKAAQKAAQANSLINLCPELANLK